MQVNHVGLLKERLDLQGADFGKVIETFGERYAMCDPTNTKEFSCKLQYGEHIGQSHAHLTKKMAKQEAAERLLAALLQAPISQGPVHSMQVQAMRGDAVLKLILLEHFTSTEPRITAGNLHDRVQHHLTNNFLNARYAALAEGLPEGLPPPTGQSTVDATQLEAFIAFLYDACDGNLELTATRVLPLLGLAL